MSNATAVHPSSLPKDFSYYCNSVIGLCIMFGVGHLPPVAPITPVGMHVAGIFLGMIYLWSTVGILWPSLLGILALGMCDYAPMRRVLSVAFGDTVPILVFFAMLLFGAIQHEGIPRYISRWFLTRKSINGRPVFFSFVFMYTTYVLAALSANVLPALLFMWAILYDVLKDVGYRKGDKYTALMVIGTMFGAISGQAAKPFTGSALLMVGAFEKVSKTQMDYLPYMLCGFVMSSVGIILYCLLMKFVFKPDMSRIADISIERFQKEALPAMDTRKKILFVALFGYLILVLLPSILPKSLAIIALIHKMGPWGVVIMFVVGLSLFKVEGKPIINVKEVIGKYVVWDVYFLVCSTIIISEALTAESTGIARFLAGSLSPLLGGKEPLTLAAVVLVFSVCVTQFANNAVMGVLLMPVIGIFAAQSGANFAALATLMILGLHIALLTPAASPYAAILYGNDAWVDRKDIAKYGAVIILMVLVEYLVVGIPLVNMVF